MDPQNYLEQQTGAAIAAAQTQLSSAISALSTAAAGWSNASLSDATKPTISGALGTLPATLETLRTTVATLCSNVDTWVGTPAAVTVSASYETPDATYGDIDAAIAALDLNLDAAYAELTLTEGNISTILNTIFDSIDGTYSPTGLDQNEIESEMDSLEDAIGSGYDRLWETPNDISTAMAAFDTSIAAILPPNWGVVSAPAGIDTGSKWSDSLWAGLKTAISGVVTTVGQASDVSDLITRLYSETDQMQVAMYAQEVERKQQALRDAKGFASAVAGSLGFTMHNSLSAALLMNAQRKYMDDLSQSSRELVKGLYEWARTAYQFAIDKGISYSSADMDFTIKYGTALLQVWAEQARAALERYKADISKIVESSQIFNRNLAAKIEAVKVNVAADEAKDKAIYSRIEAISKRYLTRLEVAKADSAIQEMNDKTQLAKIDGRIRDFMSRVEVAKTNAIIREARDKTRLAQAEQTIRGVLASLEITKTKIVSDESEDKMKLALFSEKLKGVISKLEAYKGMGSIYTESDRTQASIYASEVQMRTSNNTLAIKQAEAQYSNRVLAGQAAVDAAAKACASANQIAIGVMSGNYA